MQATTAGDGPTTALSAGEVRRLAVVRRGERLYTARVRRQLMVGVIAAGLGGLAAPWHGRAQEPERPPFQDWLAGVRDEALTRGIRPEIVAQALGDVQEPLPVVIERDRSQAEIVLPLETYVSRRLTRRTIANGRQMYTRHKRVLADIEDKYGVPARIIVAIWGVESNYGRFSGVRPTVAALATLAWDPRRATFFRGELFNALEILNRGDIEYARMKGSWAGAMGQPQFMPSSYLQYAADHDGDGRRDIWTSAPDVFASIANYLKGHGWTRDQRWGREVSLSAAAAQTIADEVGRREGTCQATRSMSVALPLAEWTRLGVRAQNGSALPAADVTAALVSGASRHFLVYGNYDALLAYNCAHAYALSVALLGDQLGSGSAPTSAAKPKAAAARKPATRVARRTPRHRAAARTPRTRGLAARLTGARS